ISVVDPASAPFQDQRVAAASKSSKLIGRAELEDRSPQGHGQTETAPGCVEAVDEGRELFLLDLDPLVAPVQPQTGIGGSVQSRRERMLNGGAKNRAATQNAERADIRCHTDRG